MYRINTINGDIHCPDGSIISTPYADASYQDYAAWVTSGNSPEEFQDESVLPVPEVVSKFQAKVALDNAGLLDTVEAIMAAPETPKVNKLAWTETQEFKRNSGLVTTMAGVLGLSSTQVDDLFRLAATIEA